MTSFAEKFTGLDFIDNEWPIFLVINQIVVYCKGDIQVQAVQ